MALIDFKKIVDELSGDSFNELKEITTDFIPFYFIKSEEADKTTYLEKLGEFFRRFEENNPKIRDNDLPLMYFEELTSLMKNRVKYGSLAEKYCAKSEDLDSKLSNISEEGLISLLEDKTKVFACFYDSLIKNGVPVENVFFSVENTDLAMVKDYFLADKPEPGKDKKAFMQKMDSLVPDQIKTAANDINEKAKGIQEGIAHKFAKKVDELHEPIHDVIEYEKDFDRYAKRSASFVLMAIIYKRIVDLESGRVD